MLLFIFIQGLVLSVFSIPMVFYGPFKNTRDMLVTTAMTTLNHQYLAKTFLSEKVIKGIMDENQVNDIEEKTDETAIVIPQSVIDDKVDTNKVDKIDKTGIVYTNVSTGKFKAHLLEITNPARVSIGTSDKIGVSGMKLDAIAKRYNAVAAINAGGFSDINGQGNGGTPEGALIENEKVLFGNSTTKYEIIGINEQNVLVLGRYNLQELKEAKIRDAASFGPFLIVNGKPLITEGNGGGGLQPRTLIGQKVDGTIMFLVIDGRQISSIGATLKQAQDIMLEHGAFNAANLDGGASTQMVFNGQTMNHPCSNYGPRSIPSGFIVQ
ncbi:MAG: phosphodiester glycosidase family protein [Clostridiaceae bacterium]|nr:phosphodiester glycosidase family protein [Clostridiaceae bacterium]